MTFASLRVQLRNLEHQTDQLLRKLSTESTLQSADRLEQELNDVLEERQDTIEALRKSVISEDTASSSVQNQQVERHYEIFVDHRGEFKRLQRTIRDMRDREELLASAITRRKQQQHEYSLEQEQYKIEQSNSLTSDLIAQAYSARDALIEQRLSLHGVQQRMHKALASVPSMNNLIRYIGSRKRRDSIILAFVIAICFMTVFFWL